MGRDPNMGRENLKNGSRNSNPSKQFLQDYNFQTLQKNFFSLVIKSFKIIASYTFGWLNLSKIRLLHHKRFFKSFSGRPAAAGLAEITFRSSGAIKTISKSSTKNCRYYC